MKQILIAYIPVIHQGYLKLLKSRPWAEILVIGSEFLEEMESIRKDIRRLEPEQVVTFLTSLELDCQVSLLDQTKVSQLASSSNELTMVMPDEDIHHYLAEKYLPEAQVEFISVYLRWDKKKTTAEQTIEAHEQVSAAELDKTFIDQAEGQAQKSSDWWRRVGAVIVKDGQVIAETFNHHVPDQNQPYFNGDPRGNFHSGEEIDKSTALHAEASLIAQAAKEGRSLSGCSLYVTTFPCPNCAKLVAYSGIKKVYFRDGYAMVDGQDILTANGIEIIRVT